MPPVLPCECKYVYIDHFLKKNICIYRPCFLLAWGVSKLEKEETNFVIPWVSDENVMPSPVYATSNMLLEWQYW